MRSNSSERTSIAFSQLCLKVELILMYNIYPKIWLLSKEKDSRIQRMRQNHLYAVKTPALLHSHTFPPATATCPLRLN